MFAAAVTTVAAATHRAQHIRRLLLSVKLVAAMMTKFATICETTQDGRHHWIASVQALAPDIVHHSRLLRFAACIACKREVAGSCENLAVQPTEWALSGGRERYGVRSPRQRCPFWARAGGPPAFFLLSRGETSRTPPLQAWMAGGGKCPGPVRRPGSGKSLSKYNCRPCSWHTLRSP